MTTICRSILVLIFVASVNACASGEVDSTWTYSRSEARTVIASECPNPALPSPRKVKGPVRELDATGETFRRVEKLRGLPPLERSRIAPETREYRAAVGFGLLYPQILLRLVVDGEEASGDLFAWWPVGIDKNEERWKWPSMPQMMAQRNCRETTKDTELATCRFCLPASFDWRSVADFLEEKGAWDLPDESALPRSILFVADGVGLEVNLVSNGSFRFYSYSNPDLRSEPEALAADAILRFVQELPK